MVYIVVAVGIAWLCAQVILKPLIEGFKRGRFVPEAIWQRGGMPSGHSALVGGLCSAIAKTSGINSPGFAIALGFSILVLYDALVTRKVLTRHGQVLQSLVKKPLDMISGHEPIEVFAGLVLGAGITWWLI